MQELAAASVAATVMVILQVSFTYVAGMLHKQHGEPTVLIVPSVLFTFLAVCLLLMIGGMLW